MTPLDLSKTWPSSQQAPQAQHPTAATCWRLQPCMTIQYMCNLVSSNEEHLSACKKVVLAFNATKAAQLEMQKCLAEEEKLLQKQQGPPQEAVAETKQLINRTAEHFRNIEPSREQWHAGMLNQVSHVTWSSRHPAKCNCNDHKHTY